MSNKYLIVGLGNIGPEYEQTRHNIGFKVLDALTEKHQVTFNIDKLCSKAEIKLKNKHLILIKPSTYMNLSGKAVRYHLEKEKIPIENLLIINDDLSLDFSTFRLKASGSSAGHNGLKNIEQMLGTQTYARFKFGIGGNFSKGKQIEYVLGNWTAEEIYQLPTLLKNACELIESFCLIGITKTMNIFN